MDISPLALLNEKDVQVNKKRRPSFSRMVQTSTSHKVKLGSDLTKKEKTMVAKSIFSSKIDKKTRK